MRYICKLCGIIMETLGELEHHFETKHPEHAWWIVWRLEGRRPGRWKIYRTLKEDGLVVAKRR